MKTKILLLSFCVVLLTSSSFAETTITLKDGSQIKGEITGLANGVYTVKTPIIGDISIAAADIVATNNAGVAAPASQKAQPSQDNNEPNLSQQVKSAQAQLMSDPQNMMDLQAMLQDPEIAQLLSDPELISLVTSQNTHAIAQNPKAQALMNNPKMRAFVNKLQNK